MPAANARTQVAASAEPPTSPRPELAHASEGTSPRGLVDFVKVSRAAQSPAPDLFTTFAVLRRD